jgi:hypothetical protein
MALKGTECEEVDWINVVPDSDEWWAFVKTIMKLKAP